MKISTLFYTFIAVAIAIVISSCSQPTTETASTSAVEPDSTATQMEADSATANIQTPAPPVESEPKSEPEPEPEPEHEPEPQIQFTESGAFAIQVESWRSELSAQKRADYWKAEGYPTAFVVRYGNEETGDVWFRVQLGQVSTLETAELLRKKLIEENQQPSWIVEMSSQ